MTKENVYGRRTAVVRRSTARRQRTSSGWYYNRYRCHRRNLRQIGRHQSLSLAFRSHSRDRDDRAAIFARSASHRTRGAFQRGIRTSLLQSFFAAAGMLRHCAGHTACIACRDPRQAHCNQNCEQTAAHSFACMLLTSRAAKGSKTQRVQQSMVPDGEDRQNGGPAQPSTAAYARGFLVGREISRTTSAVSCSGAARAMSACETIPQHAPLSSTTGTRRIWFSSIVAQQSSTLVSGVVVTTEFDITSRTAVCFGSLPCATARQVMSRSVTTPVGRRCSSRTGISPQSLSAIIFATSCKEVCGEQHAGFSVMISRTCMTISSRRSVAFKVLSDKRPRVGASSQNVSIPTSIVLATARTARQAEQNDDDADDDTRPRGDHGCALEHPRRNDEPCAE